MTKTSIGIDLGGTNIKGVALSSEGTILCQFTLPTSDGNDVVWKNAVCDMMAKIKKELNIDDVVVGISAPGIPNKGNTSIAHMPGRLIGLENFDWTSFLKSATYVVNDAIAALIAEQKFGAAIGYRNVIMLTLGTGVGGAILIDGKPYVGANKLAGHLGHIIVESAEEPDIVGIPGSLEQAIGNYNILERSQNKYSTTELLLQAVADNDDFATSIWMSSVKKLALGISSLINVLSPEVIILGGGITKADHLLFDPLDTYMNQYEWRPSGQKTKIIRARYGEFSGAVGAAIFAQNKN